MESSRSQGKNGVANAVVGVGALTPHPRNYNQHSAGQVGDLRRSLKRFGQVRSIVVQAQAEPGRWLIVAGHGIVEAARAEGLDTLRADIIPAGWDDAMVLAYLAADNELARQGQPDEGQLAALLRDVAAQADRELAALAAGSEARLTEMLATLDGGAAGDAEPQVDRAAELNEKWQVRPGDLWRIGEHRLACGDCTDRAVVERVMAGEKADVVFIDPPYMTFGSSTGKLTPGDFSMLVPFWDGVFKTAQENLKSGRAAFVCCDWRTYPLLFNAALKVMSVKNLIVWDMGGALKMGTGGFRFSYELIVYATNAAFGRNWKTDGEGSWEIKDRSIRDLWTIRQREAAPGINRDHASQKPTELIEFALTNASQNGEGAFDYFLGSGTTLVACQNLGRRGRGIEISPEYCAVVLQRMSDAFPGIEIERLTPRAGMDVDDENGAK